MGQKHINDNWNRTLFTDETSFWFTLEFWYKGIWPVRPISKDRTRINAWGGFCIKGKTSLFCFRENMTAQFYVNIITKHLPEANKMVGKK